MSNTVHFEIKATLQQESLIRHAAEIARKSMNEFILDSICSAAENALLDQRLFILDDVNWERFLDAMYQPAKVKCKLHKLIKDKSPWE